MSPLSRRSSVAAAEDARRLHRGDPRDRRGRQRQRAQAAVAGGGRGRRRRQQEQPQPQPVAEEDRGAEGLR